MPTSLADKLNLKAITRLVVLNAPAGYVERLGRELKGIELVTRAGRGADAVLLFVNNLAETQKLAPKAIAAVKQDGLLWIAYPKGTSGVKTDVNRDKLWPVVAALGQRPVRQVALDEVWSALRFRPKAA